MKPKTSNIKPEPQLSPRAKKAQALSTKNINDMCIKLSLFSHRAFDIKYNPKKHPYFTVKNNYVQLSSVVFCNRTKNFTLKGNGHSSIIHTSLISKTVERLQYQDKLCRILNATLTALQSKPSKK